MNHEQNLGALDRITRLILGSLAFLVGYFFQIGGWLGWLLIISGVILIITGVSGYCLTYKVFGWSTKQRMR